jgi:MSHA biogenesis protein MshO
MIQFKRTAATKSARYADGFTLVELVVAILVSSVMAIGIVSYIARSAEGLNSTAVRARLASSGRVAIDRIAMEIHNALPNSIRVASSGSTQCIEFIPINAATSYVNPPFGSASLTFDIVDIKDEATTIYPSSPPPLYAVIYPRRQNQVYDGDNGASSLWPNFPTSRRPIQEISSMAASASTNRTTVTLTKSHRFRRRSPTQRLFCS